MQPADESEGSCEEASLKPEKDSDTTGAQIMHSLHLSIRALQTRGSIMLLLKMYLNLLPGELKAFVEHGRETLMLLNLQL